VAESPEKLPKKQWLSLGFPSKSMGASSAPLFAVSFHLHFALICLHTYDELPFYITDLSRTYIVDTRSTFLMTSLPLSVADIVRLRSDS